MNTTTMPPVASLTPTAPTLPPVDLGTGRKGRRNGAANNPPAPDQSLRTPHIVAINNAAMAYNAGAVEQSRLFGIAAKTIVAPRASFKEAVAQAAASGFFTREQLIEVVMDAVKKAGMSDTTASRALIDCGVRQRAPRSDRGSRRGNNPALATPAPAVVPPPAPAPAMATDPESIAKALTAILGAEEARTVLSKAYYLVK